MLGMLMHASSASDLLKADAHTTNLQQGHQLAWPLHAVTH
jgi:hypothetical protein